MQEIKAFFDKFSSDFGYFDGNLIVDRYLVPFIPVTSAGETKLLNSKAEVANYFQGYLNAYRDKGVVACSYKDMDVHQIGECVYVGIVTWLLTGDNDKVLVSWRESYNLLEQNGNLFVYSSANFK